MIRRIVTTALLACLGLGTTALLTGCNGAVGGVVERGNTGAPTGTGFVTKVLAPQDRNRKYVVFVPHNYNPAQKYPVIIFLHGIGEAGSDASKNLSVGLGPVVAEHAASFPFIVIFPQSTGDWAPDSQNADDAMAILQQTKRDYSIDADRIFLTGLSTGGYGTWAIGAKYRTQFAGLVPMCAYSAKSEMIPELTKIPVWCFHNSLDPFVLAAGDHWTCDEINKQGGSAKYTEYGAFGHDCWDRAYSEGEIFTWMLSQHRAGGTAQSPAAAPKAAAPAMIPAPARSAVITHSGSTNASTPPTVY